MNILAASPAVETLSIGDAGIIALLGYGVVFLGLVALMTVVILLGKVFIAAGNRKKAEGPATSVSEPVPAAPAPAAPTAPGSAGGVKLYDVEPKTAAMIMAIVADRMGKPLNELRFISIKEVK